MEIIKRGVLDQSAEPGCVHYAGEDEISTFLCIIALLLILMLELYLRYVVREEEIPPG